MTDGVTNDQFVPARVVLIRHGESNTTVAQVLGGPRTCSGLSLLGRQQAERLRSRIEDTDELDGATALYSSGYPRAIETADVLAPALGLDVRQDERFGEHDPGPDCDGLTFQEFVDRHGMPDWNGDLHGVRFPGGESLAAFQFRVGEVLSAVFDEHPGGLIVVACHGGVVDSAFRYLLRLPPIGGFELHTVNTSLTEFVQTKPGRWRLSRYNDAAHLAGLPKETPRESG